MTEVGALGNAANVENEERGKRVYFCRRPRHRSWAEAWASVKHFN